MGLWWVSVENGYIDYDWSNNNNCNVGLVIQAMYHTNSAGVNKIFKGATAFNKYATGIKKKNKEYNAGGWRNLFTYYKGIEGDAKCDYEPINDLVRKGLTVPVISSLEYLSDKGIMRRSTIDQSGVVDFSNDVNYVKYLRAWIDMIREYQNETHHRIYDNTNGRPIQ